MDVLTEPSRRWLAGGNLAIALLCLMAYGVANGLKAVLRATLLKGQRRRSAVKLPARRHPGRAQ